MEITTMQVAMSTEGKEEKQLVSQQWPSIILNTEYAMVKDGDDNNICLYILIISSIVH